MGSLALPPSGEVYLDAQVVIYTIERHPIYAPLLDPLWMAVQAGQLVAVTSELTILEVVVGPLKSGDTALHRAFESLFVTPGVRLIPVAQPILRGAAQLRASIPKLRTPDAIHAATALHVSVGLFVTNDFVFRSVPGLPTAILDDHRSAP